MKEAAAIWRLPGYTDLLSVATDFIISTEEFAWLARIGDGEALSSCNQAASDSCQSAEKSSTSSSSFAALLSTNDAAYDERGSSNRSESFAADSTRAYGSQSLSSISTKKAEADDTVLWTLAPPEIQPFLGTITALTQRADTPIRDLGVQDRSQFCRSSDRHVYIAAPKQLLSFLHITCIQNWSGA